jgi:hypothetical protein
MLLSCHSIHYRFTTVAHKFFGAVREWWELIELDTSLERWWEPYIMRCKGGESGAQIISTESDPFAKHRDTYIICWQSQSQEICLDGGKVREEAELKELDMSSPYIGNLCVCGTHTGGRIRLSFFSLSLFIYTLFSFVDWRENRN